MRSTALKRIVSARARAHCHNRPPHFPVGLHPRFDVAFERRET